MAETVKIYVTVVHINLVRATPTGVVSSKLDEIKNAYFETSRMVFNIHSDSHHEI